MAAKIIIVLAALAAVVSANPPSYAPAYANAHLSNHHLKAHAIPMSSIAAKALASTDVAAIATPILTSHVAPPAIAAYGTGYGSPALAGLGVPAVLAVGAPGIPAGAKY